MTHPSVDPIEVESLYAQFNGGVPLSAPFIPAFHLGTLLLGIGLFRGGQVSRTAAAVFAVSAPFPNVVPQENLVVSGLVGMAPMVASMAVFAVAIARQARNAAPQPS